MLGGKSYSGNCEGLEHLALENSKAVNIYTRDRDHNGD